MFTLYKVTCTISQKSYIGVTRITVHKRWICHKSEAKTTSSNRKFFNAIRKYGTDCWIFEELYATLDEDHAFEMEIFFIKEYNTYYTGYNSDKGGKNNYSPKPKWTEERRQKQSTKMKGRLSHPGKSGAQNPSYGKPGTMLGKKHSDQAKQTMSKNHHLRRPVIINGILYNSVNEAARSLHKAPKTIIKLQSVMLD